MVPLQGKTQENMKLSLTSIIQGFNIPRIKVGSDIKIHENKQ